jgi:hypothetical protein
MLARSTYAPLLSGSNTIQCLQMLGRGQGFSSASWCPLSGGSGHPNPSRRLFLSLAPHGAVVGDGLRNNLTRSQMRVAAGPSLLRAPRVQLGGDPWRLRVSPGNVRRWIRAEANGSVDLALVWRSCGGLGVVASHGGWHGRGGPDACGHQVVAASVGCVVRVVRRGGGRR